jgi:hypothetical protein
MFEDITKAAEGFVNPDQIMKLAKGIKFPSSKNELVNSFKNNNAPKEIISVIEKLPDKNYSSPQDLLSALPSMLGSGK